MSFCLDHGGHYIDIDEAFNKCLSITLKENRDKHKITKNMGNFLKENLIIIDENYFMISILNIITNAYEAVQRNFASQKINESDFNININAEYNPMNKRLSISIKNYASYIDKDKFDLIFNPGISGNIKTNSGYGLAILKDIIQDLYHGEILLESELNNLT